MNKSINNSMKTNILLTFDLAKNDFKNKFAGSVFGIIWAFIQPIVTIAVYWFVFQMGFRNGNTESGVPFALWLSAGLIPWFFFSEAWNTANNSLLEYSYLVKKVVFDVKLIPFVKILSALFVHVFFVCFLMLLFICNGLFPNIFWIQTIYCSIAMIILVTGLSYLTSCLVIFFRDISQIIGVILQVQIWLTPIMWNLSMLPERFAPIFMLNPMYYIVYGYRCALVDKCWMFASAPVWLHIYFWAFTFIVFFAGTRLFEKLKIHFADVL